MRHLGTPGKLQATRDSGGFACGIGRCGAAIQKRVFHTPIRIGQTSQNLVYKRWLQKRNHTGVLRKRSNWAWRLYACAWLNFWWKVKRLGQDQRLPCLEHWELAWWHSASSYHVRSSLGKWCREIACGGTGTNMLSSVCIALSGAQNEIASSYTQRKFDAHSHTQNMAIMTQEAFVRSSTYSDLCSCPQHSQILSSLTLYDLLKLWERNSMRNDPSVSWLAQAILLSYPQQKRNRHRESFIVS